MGNELQGNSASLGLALQARATVYSSYGFYWFCGLSSCFQACMPKHYPLTMSPAPREDLLQWLLGLADVVGQLPAAHYPSLRSPHLSSGPLAHLPIQHGLSCPKEERVLPRMQKCGSIISAATFWVPRMHTDASGLPSSWCVANEHCSR